MLAAFKEAFDATGQAKLDMYTVRLIFEDLGWLDEDSFEG
jgi:hypothetical protein